MCRISQKINIDLAIFIMFWALRNGSPFPNGVVHVSSCQDNDEDTLGQQHLSEATEEQEDVATSEKEGEADAILMEDVVCDTWL